MTVAFEGGKYTNDVRACCYELLSLNVGVNNVKTVVLTNIAIDSLPNMMLECLTVAQAQVGCLKKMVPITQFKLMEPLSLVKSFLLLILPPLEKRLPLD